MVADWLRQHPSSNEDLRDPVVFDNNGDWNQDTRWSLRNQTDLQTGQSQKSGSLNLQKQDEDTNTRLGVSASLNEQRRGDESLRTFNAGFSGSGNQETQWGDVTAQSSGGLTRDKNGSSLRMQSAVGLKREDASGAEWSGNITGRADSDRNTAFQGSIQRATEVGDRKIQEQMNIRGSGLRASRAQNNFGRDVDTTELDSGFTQRTQSDLQGSRIGADLSFDSFQPSFDASMSRTKRKRSWNRDNISGDMSILKGNASGRFNGRKLRANAQGNLWESNASIRRRNRRSLFDEEFGMSTTLSGSAEVGGQAKAEADFSRGFDAEAEAFLGTKAQASLSGDVEWDREDDYSGVIRDHLDNFPGTWDDKLLERVPDKALKRAGQVLFGKGRTKLASGSVGMDARAGIGVSGSASAQMSEDGLLELGGSFGGAAGIGGGVSARGGLNPVALGRLGVLKGMEGVNEGYDSAEQIAKSIRERAAADTAIVGGQIEESAKKDGPLGALARWLLRMDSAARGKKEE